MNNTDFDTAIDFARNYRKTIPFCAKMVNHFDRLGFLTERQVAALLRIKQEKLTN